MKKRVLSIFVAVVMLVSLVPTVFAAGTTMDADEWEVLRLVNEHRMDMGLEPLSVFSGIQNIADLRAEEISSSFSHTRPNGESCFTAYSGLSYQTAAENIAAGQRSPSSVMTSWLNSSGHRANIEKASLTHLGVGLVTTGNGYGKYWSQNFIGSNKCTYTSITLSKTSIEGSGDLDTLLDNADIKVTAVCSVHGTCELPLIAEMCSGYSGNVSGSQTVKVTLGSAEATLTVTSDSSAPDTTTPDDATPDTTTPDDTTAPDDTTPDDTTTPDDATPDTTVPDDSTPDDAAPDEDKDTAPDKDENTTPDEDKDTAPDEDEDTTPDEDENTTPDEDENTAPDEDENTAPDEDENTAPNEDENTASDEDENTTPDEDEDTAPDEDEDTAPDKDEDDGGSLLNMFTDITTGTELYNAVQWALKKGITQGITDILFGAKSSCTRAMAVTFLWRAAGEPEPYTTNNPFTDVSESDYYYKAVLWAVDMGITNGTSETTFSPDESCERSQIITFLWRFNGMPSLDGDDTEASFTDVSAVAYYNDAVNWAFSLGITTGTNSEGTIFGSSNTCERGQIITFIFRSPQ